jgi:SAM-dependent methyltransferase
VVGRRRPGRTPDVRGLVDEHLGAGRPTGWFEPVYAAARGRADRVPWGGEQPHPYVTDWLDDPVVPPPGRRAVVVGCGLGADAAEVDERGYEVTAFDVAPSAVAWARKRLPATVDVRVQDLLELPDDLVGAFDLVVEVRTVQSLPGVVRDAAMHAVASLAGPGGVVVVVTLLATSADAAAAWEGPPWAQAPSELAAYLAGGLRRVALEHPEPAGEPAIDVRLTFVRDDAGGAGAPSRASGEDVLGIHR